MNEMTLLEKLNYIQTKLKAPKGQFNSFANFKYRSCEDILEAVKPLLEETKSALIINDEIINVGSRFYIKATVNLIDQTCGISSSAFAREADTKKGMDEAQITGATSSYARKYALNGLFCIDDTKDADSHDNNIQNSKPVETPKPKAEASMLETVNNMEKKVFKSPDEFKVWRVDNNFPEKLDGLKDYDLTKIYLRLSDSKVGK